MDQATELEVLQRPLDGYEKPLAVDRSDGRFIARCDRYLDPAVYTQGRDVTIAGKVLGSQTGTVGESSYVYPLLSCLEIRLWPQTVYAPDAYDLYPAWYWGFWFWRPPYFGYPYYPRYRHHHQRHQRHRRHH
jgi:outer membrane lipoprotein